VRRLNLQADGLQLIVQTLVEKRNTEPLRKFD